VRDKECIHNIGGKTAWNPFTWKTEKGWRGNCKTIPMEAEPGYERLTKLSQDRGFSCYASCYATSVFVSYHHLTVTVQGKNDKVST
jgi:hypothetical protein